MPRPNLPHLLLNDLIGMAGRFPQLDGLRAVAIILVLLRHGVGALQHNYPDHFSGADNGFLITVFLNGWVGVDLFFVLSGFLIGFHLLAHWPSNGFSLHFFSKFWLKRILRTFPLYYAVILIVILNLVPGYSFVSDDPWSEVFNHLVFMQDYLGTNILPPLWSLATEEKFYLLVPLVAALVFRMSRSWTNVCIFFLVIACVPVFLRVYMSTDEAISNYSHFFWWVRAPFHMALDGLLMGFSLSVFYSKVLYCQKLISPRVGELLVLALVLVLAIILGYKEWMNTDNWLWSAIVIFIVSAFFCVIVGLILVSGALNEGFLSSRFLRFISRISYALYLSHLLVIPSSFMIASILFPPVESPRLFGVMFFILYILLSVAFSIVLYTLIERPFLRLKEKVKL